MRIAVSDIPEEGIENELKFPVSRSGNFTGGDIRAVFKLVKFGDRVQAEGHASSVVSLVCSRCLNKFSFAVENDFNVEFVPYRDFADVEEHELMKAELDVSFYKEDEIDIGELVKEQILLAVPMKPLCKQSCRGLCPECGKNLNEFSCECASEAVDIRFVPLEKLRDSLKNRGKPSKDGDT